METTIGTVLVSVLISCCIFLLWLYLEQRRRVRKKKEIIKGLTADNMSLINKLAEVSAELKTLKTDENTK